MTKVRGRPSFGENANEEDRRLHREKQVVLFHNDVADGKTTSRTIINERVKLTVTDIAREAIAGLRPLLPQTATEIDRFLIIAARFFSVVNDANKLRALRNGTCFISRHYTTLLYYGATIPSL